MTHLFDFIDEISNYSLACRIKQPVATFNPAPDCSSNTYSNLAFLQSRICDRFIPVLWFPVYHVISLSCVIINVKLIFLFCSGHFLIPIWMFTALESVKYYTGGKGISKHASNGMFTVAAALVGYLLRRVLNRCHSWLTWIHLFQEVIFTCMTWILTQYQSHLLGQPIAIILMLIYSQQKGPTWINQTKFFVQLKMVYLLHLLKRAITVLTKKPTLPKFYHQIRYHFF